MKVLLAYSFARMLYSWGYMMKPKFRVPGAIMQDIAIVHLVYLAVKAGIALL